MIVVTSENSLLIILLLTVQSNFQGMQPLGGMRMPSQVPGMMGSPRPMQPQTNPDPFGNL